MPRRGKRNPSLFSSPITHYPLHFLNASTAQQSPTRFPDSTIPHFFHASTDKRLHGSTILYTIPRFNDSPFLPRLNESPPPRLNNPLHASPIQRFPISSTSQRINASTAQQSSTRFPDYTIPQSSPLHPSQITAHLFFAHHPLLITHYIFLTTHYSPFTTYYSLITVSF